MRDPNAPVPAPLKTPLNWRKPDPEGDLRKARSYVPIVERVLRETATLPEIEIHLAIGAACPALTDHDKAIWIYVCRQYDGWIELRQTERIRRVEVRRDAIAAEIAGQILAGEVG